MFSSVLYKAVGLSGFECILLSIRFPTGATLYSADTFMIIVCSQLSVCLLFVKSCRFTIAWHNAELSRPHDMCNIWALPGDWTHTYTAYHYHQTLR